VLRENSGASARGEDSSRGLDGGNEHTPPSTGPRCPRPGFRPEGERLNLSPELCRSPAAPDTTHGAKLRPDAEAVVGHPLLTRGGSGASHHLISEPMKSCL